MNKFVELLFYKLYFIVYTLFHAYRDILIDPSSLNVYDNFQFQSASVALYTLLKAVVVDT